MRRLDDCGHRRAARSGRAERAVGKRSGGPAGLADHRAPHPSILTPVSATTGEGMTAQRPRDSNQRTAPRSRVASTPKNADREKRGTTQMKKKAANTAEQQRRVGTRRTRVVWWAAGKQSSGSCLSGPTKRRAPGSGQRQRGRRRLKKNVARCSCLTRSLHRVCCLQLVDGEQSGALAQRVRARPDGLAQIAQTTRREKKEVTAGEHVIGSDSSGLRMSTPGRSKRNRGGLPNR